MLKGAAALAGQLVPLGREEPEQSGPAVENGQGGAEVARPHRVREQLVALQQMAVEQARRLGVEALDNQLVGGPDVVGNLPLGDAPGLFWC